MHEKITDIQNLFWKAYKNYKGTGSMSQYNADVDEIIEKYRDDHAMIKCKKEKGTYTSRIWTK